MPAPTTDLNLNYLRYFHTVAEEGSIAAAARKLGVSQSTLSEQIKQLELSLGERLFDRGGGPLKLNDAGRATLEQTHNVFAAVERIAQRFRPEDEPTRDLLAMGVCSSISRAFAADYLLPVFCMDQVRVKVRQGDYDYLLHSLITHELDLMLSENRPTDPDTNGIEVRVVLEPELVAVASPDLANGLKDYPHGLDQAPLITYSAHSKYRFDVDQVLHEATARPDLIGEVDDVGIQRVVATRGVAVAFVPRPVIEEDLAQGSLVELGSAAAIEGRVYALYHAEQPSQHVLAALDALTGFGQTEA